MLSGLLLFNSFIYHKKLQDTYQTVKIVNSFIVARESFNSEGLLVNVRLIYKETDSQNLDKKIDYWVDFNGRFVWPN